MKQIYMPNKNELYQMQDYGANIYKYLLIKAIEVIIMEGILYPKKGMLENQYKYIKQNEEITRSICYLYPDEMKYSESAQYDQELCIALINKSNERISLEGLSNFSKSVLYSPYVIQTLAMKLEEELVKKPQFRFEYQYSSLLEDIFGCNLTKENLIFTPNEETIKALCNIEPMYILKYSQELSRILQNSKYLGNFINEAIETYAKRYFIDSSIGEEYIGKDILTNPNQDVKRLIKCINQQYR